MDTAKNQSRKRGTQSIQFCGIPHIQTKWKKRNDGFITCGAKQRNMEQKS